MGNTRKFFEGQIHEVPSGRFEIIELDRQTFKHAKILWLDTGNYQRVRLDVIKRGNIKNPMHPSVQGVGFLGVGPHTGVNKEMYNSWASMIARCYREKLKEKYETYRDCYCCDDWHNYQNYADWFLADKWRKSGWNLDKDLLILGNKLYSPETCVFLPKELNTHSLSFTKTTSVHGYKNVSWDPVREVWMSVVWSKTTRNNRTTGGRFLDIKDAARDAAKSEIQKYTDIIDDYSGKIDDRAIEAFKVMVLTKQKEMEEI